MIFGWQQDHQKILRRHLVLQELHHLVLLCHLVLQEFHHRGRKIS